MTASDRFWRRVEKTETCWLWTGSLRCGYGNLSVDGRVVAAHRFAYEDRVGPIADGLELDHTCREKRCVNPAHLDPVTHAENVRRHFAAALGMRCRRGHDMADPRNVGASNHGRYCRVCDRERRRARYHESRSAA